MSPKGSSGSERRVYSEIATERCNLGLQNTLNEDCSSGQQQDAECTIPGIWHEKFIVEPKRRRIAAEALISLPKTISNYGAVSHQR